MEPKMTLNFYLCCLYLLSAAFQLCSVWCHVVLDAKQTFYMLDRRSTCTAPGTKVADFFNQFFFWLRKWTSGSVLSLQGYVQGMSNWTLTRPLSMQCSKPLLPCSSFWNSFIYYFSGWFFNLVVFGCYSKFFVLFTFTWITYFFKPDTAWGY